MTDEEFKRTVERFADDLSLLVAETSKRSWVEVSEMVAAECATTDLAEFLEWFDEEPA